MQIKKMKVSHAAQVISHSLASFINILSKMPSEKLKQNRYWARLKF
jgi:hypothetical protein